MKYISSWRDKTGRRRYRFRRGPVSRMMPGEPSTPQFLRRYAELLEETEPQAPAPDRSVSALIDAYYESQKWASLKDSTKRAHGSQLEMIRKDMGARPVSGMEPVHVERMMVKFAHTPGSANNRLKRLRALMKYAIRLRWIKDDPTLEAEFYQGGEIHTWTADELARFEGRWPIGTRERLAYALHLYTGQRKSDVRKMGWGDIEDGMIRVTQEKTGAKLWIPLHAELSVVLAKAERKHLLILTTHAGAQITDGGYGNWFREACQAAGLPQRCSSHGLRKAAAARLAEAGCSTREIMSITGHRSLSEVERYTRGAEQKRLARSAMARIVKPGPGAVKPEGKE